MKKTAIAVMLVAGLAVAACNNNSATPTPVAPAASEAAAIESVAAEVEATETMAAEAEASVAAAVEEAVESAAP